MLRACQFRQPERLSADPMRQLHQLAIGILVAFVHSGQVDTKSVERVFAFAHSTNGCGNLCNRPAF